MKKILIIKLFLLPLLISCYGVNKKTTQIVYVNNYCLAKSAWDTIISYHSIDNIEDSVFLDALVDFKNVPFPVSLIYFKEGPAEIIGVDYSSIRYLFNPKISNEILDGLSPALKEQEIKRIRNRVQRLLMEYQCEEGKEQARKLIKDY